MSEIIKALPDRANEIVAALRCKYGILTCNHPDCQYAKEGRFITCDFCRLREDAADLLERYVDFPNDPLTLEELRGMDGEPAYCKEYQCWGIVSVEKIGSWANKPFFIGKYQLVRFDYDLKKRKLTLYRRKPEEGEQNV